MAKYKLDYIWLDGYSPVPNLRTKCCIKEFDSFPEVADLPLWGFDGSSTEQAEGHSSDCLLKPISTYYDSQRKDAWLHILTTPYPKVKRHSTTNLSKLYCQCVINFAMVKAFIYVVHSYVSSLLFLSAISAASPSS